MERPRARAQQAVQGLNSIEFQQDVQQDFQQITGHSIRLNTLLKITLNSWNSIELTPREIFGREDLTDVTLSCFGGKPFHAHKIILAAASTYFRNFFKEVQGKMWVQLAKVTM